MTLVIIGLVLLILILSFGAGAYAGDGRMDWVAFIGTFGVLIATVATFVLMYAMY